MKINKEIELLLNEFKESYEPKNRTIDVIIEKAEVDLKKGKIPEIILQKFVTGIYSACFVEKIKVGDKAYATLKKMEKISKSNSNFHRQGLWNMGGYYLK